MSFGGPWSVWNRFDDEWMQTRRAVNLFLTGSAFVVALTVIWFSHLDIASMRFLFRLPLTLVAMLGVLSGFFVWFGMWRYWARLDYSTKWAKRLSFAVLLLGVWWGACVYCLAVYVPQVTRKETFAR
jgi:hypothetical protein